PYDLRRGGWRGPRGGPRRRGSDHRRVHRLLHRLHDPAALRGRRGAARAMKTLPKIILFVSGWVVVGVILGLVFGSEGKNDAYKPQNEFKLDAWISLKIGPIDMSINKAVLYLFLAAAATTITMTYVAN